MKFTFVGDGDNDPESVECFGLTFPIGQAVDVSDANAIRKLRGNVNFKEGEGVAAPAKRKPGRPPKAPPKIVQVELPDDE